MYLIRLETKHQPATFHRRLRDTPFIRSMRTGLVGAPALMRSSVVPVLCKPEQAKETPS